MSWQFRTQTIDKQQRIHGKWDKKGNKHTLTSRRFCSFGRHWLLFNYYSCQWHYRAVWDLLLSSRDRAYKVSIFMPYELTPGTEKRVNNLLCFFSVALVYTSQISSKLTLSGLHILSALCHRAHYCIYLLLLSNLQDLLECNQGIPTSFWIFFQVTNMVICS